MLKARWCGYEIDSSEAAYDIKVRQPEGLGTLVRGLLSSGYFARSYYLLFEEPLVRLRQFIAERGGPQDELGVKALEHLEKQIAKFDPESHRVSTIGVRAIESILNYVGAHRKELLEARTFRFELTEEQREMFKDYGYEFQEGAPVDETEFYSEEEIPLDGVVLYLGCSLVGLGKLSPEEQGEAVRSIKEEARRMGIFDSGFIREMGGWDRVLRRHFDRAQDLTLRVRLNPDATFAITGRWFDDGQFAYGYYDYVLCRAAKKAGAKIDLHMIY
ncbi:MAG: hypothetical protein ACE5LD_01005 [Candidatus Bipolaricaulia bacterium]